MAPLGEGEGGEIIWKLPFRQHLITKQHQNVLTAKGFKCHKQSMKPCTASTHSVQTRWRRETFLVPDMNQTWFLACPAWSLVTMPTMLYLSPLNTSLHWYISRFQTFAMFWMLYAFFWVIPPQWTPQQETVYNGKRRRRPSVPGHWHPQKNRRLPRAQSILKTHPNQSLPIPEFASPSS